MDNAVAIPVSLFLDYSCPHCYIGSVRLQRLSARHPLTISWRFIETQPNIPTAGTPRTPQDNAATQHAREESIPFQEPELAVNTRRALLLAQATLDRRPEVFDQLHTALFNAYFVEGRNIGDPQVLEQIADGIGIGELLAPAWETPEYFALLLNHVEAARRLELSTVPTLVVSGRTFSGTTSLDVLERALEEAAQG